MGGAAVAARRVKNITPDVMLHQPPGAQVRDVGRNQRLTGGTLGFLTQGFCFFKRPTWDVHWGFDPYVFALSWVGRVGNARIVLTSEMFFFFFFRRFLQYRLALKTTEKQTYLIFVSKEKQLHPDPRGFCGVLLKRRCFKEAGAP